MHILLSNDDGIHAEGIQVMAEALRKIATVTIVAPDRNRSAASSSLTLVEPLRPLKLPNGDYCINGTPADCVHLALNGFLAGRVDLVVSGINAGANLGDDVIYSGTVAAALEGRHLGLPSIAVSLEGRIYFETAAQVVCDLIPRLHDNVLGEREIININVPDIPYADLKGTEITRLGRRHKAEPVVKMVSPRNETVYWIGAAGAAADSGPGTDFNAVDRGFASITPLQIDLTHVAQLPSIRQWML